MQPSVDKQTQRPTLLLVHGAWHAEWCWEGDFSSHLKVQGFTVETMNLPGHGKAGPQKLAWYTISDYVDAVEAKLAAMGSQTVVLGHSLGGYVVHKLMERQPAHLAGVVLLAAATQRGVWGVVGHQLTSSPINFLVSCLTADLYRLVNTPEKARSLFHLADLPEKTVRANWKRQSNESYRAFLDMLVFNPLRPKKADPALPKLVLGGEVDAIFPPNIVRRNAESLGEKANIYPGMPHNLTQNSGWKEVADDLGAWLNELPSAQAA